MLAALLGLWCAAAGAAAEPVMDRAPSVQYRFYGELGARVRANLEQWTLRAPGANPGLLAMFQRRDRAWPYGDMVPWAGEFAGKFLTSAVLSRRMLEDARLDAMLQPLVDAVVAAQGPDGYLGPWRAHEHWTGYWDLWGHYHLMLGLLAWYDDTGDAKAFDACVKAAGGICDLYAAGAKRPIDAGTPEVNLAILHGMGQMYRRTENPRYLDFMMRVVEDMERAGDWLNQGAAGVPYWQLPRNGTRWESLHTVQGLAELYRITGEPRYKDAVLNLWRSLRDADRHPSGAFSSGEIARGSVYEPGAIETCCSIAWLALTADVLRLTGDPTAADELELTTWNQGLAAQHPSGSWCTYDTPLNGIRAPSYHQINFQYRVGTPELNCCSVNGSRALGHLREWAVMQDATGLYVNFYGPGACTVQRADGEIVTLAQDTGYPADGVVRLTVKNEGAPARFELRLRIPAWSRSTEVRVEDSPMAMGPSPGSYLRIGRMWEGSTELLIRFDMHPRHWPGQAPQYAGRAAFYYGPLLLAFDPWHSPLEVEGLPPIDAAAFAPVLRPAARSAQPGVYPPIGLWEAAAADGTTIALCDFASAGAHGTAYAAWLPAVNTDPVPAALLYPEAGETARPGPVTLAWRAASPDAPCTVLVARDADFGDIALRVDEVRGGRLDVTAPFDAPGTYYWTVQCDGAGGPIGPAGGARRVVCDPAAPHGFIGRGEGGLLLDAPLAGAPEAAFARFVRGPGTAAAPGRAAAPDTALRFDGGGLAQYDLAAFPQEEYSFAAWVCAEALERPGIQQVFSAWRAGMDDPLRVTIDGGRVHARIEAGTALGTAGAPLIAGRWTHVAAVKRGETLTLYIDGAPAASAAAPARVGTASRSVALGGNPQYTGESEAFVGRMQSARLWQRALGEDEVRALAAP